MNLISRTQIQVRFSEVDSIKMVWHGHYVTYLEDAREQWGKEFGLDYKTIYEAGYFAPIYDLQLRYLGQAQLNDLLEVEISYKPSKSAKICFDYTITRVKDQTLILKASSIQLLTNHAGELETSMPTFMEKWYQETQNYYTITQQEGNTQESTYCITINPNCNVFKGHFPQESICPGACNIQMIIAICESLLSKSLLVEQIKKVKFTKLMHPSIENLQLTLKVQEKDTHYKIRATLNDETSKYLDFSAIAIEKI